MLKVLDKLILKIPVILCRLRCWYLAPCTLSSNDFEGFAGGRMPGMLPSGPCGRSSPSGYPRPRHSDRNRIVGKISWFQAITCYFLKCCEHYHFPPPPPPPPHHHHHHHHQHQHQHQHHHHRHRRHQQTR